MAGPDVTQLSRGDLFTDAANLDVDSDEELLRFLWRVLAWGSGMKLRLNRKRIRAVAVSPSSAKAALRQALIAAREDPAQAYEALRPRSRNASPYSTVLDLAQEEAACVRRRRFVLDSKPVLLATSYLPMSLVAGSAITQEDTGPGGTYARLAELGHEPVHFREEIRSRMPSKDETARLGMATGTPVILICRTAFTAQGRPVEVNEMTLDAASYVLEYDFSANPGPTPPHTNAPASADRVSIPR